MSNLKDYIYIYYFIFRNSEWLNIWDTMYILTYYEIWIFCRIPNQGSYCFGHALGELYSIRLCRNEATDEASPAQKDLKKVPLRQLSLRGFPKVTDHSLKYLEKLNLDLLDLTYTGVTLEGIEHYLIENPNCRIIHPNYCICKPKFSV